MTSNSALVFLILMCVYKSKTGYCRVKGIGQCVCPQKGAAQRGKVQALVFDGSGFESQPVNLLDLWP